MNVSGGKYDDHILNEDAIGSVTLNRQIGKTPVYVVDFETLSSRLILFKICKLVESKTQKAILTVKLQRYICLKRFISVFCKGWSQLHYLSDMNLFTFANILLLFFANYLKILPKFESEKDQKCYFVVAQVRWCGKDSLDDDHRRNQLSHAT